MRGIALAVILVAVLLAAGCTTKEVPQTGSLVITSTPAGITVQVVLDGNYQGQTPLNITNLSAGYHLLQLSSPGYKDQVEPLTVNAGERMHILADYPPIPTPTPVTLTPPPTTETPPGPTVSPTALPETPLPPGSLYVTSFPSGATIYLDGKGYGVTPNLIQNLTPRTYELRLSLVGWEDYTIPISVSPGLTTTEEATLSS